MTNRGPVWFGIALVVAVAAIGAWIYFVQPVQSLNVAMNLVATPQSVTVGDPFDLSVGFTNNSGSAMQNASVSVLLPNGVVSADSPDQRVVTQTVGDVSAGGVSHEDFHLIATNGANTVVHITAKVMYGVQGSSAQFNTSQSIDVPMGQPAVSVSIAAPNNVFSGQTFPMVITYVNNTGHAVSGLTLQAQYPTSSSASPFTFAGASSSLPSNGNSAWSLGTIAPNGGGSITINGSLVGPNGSSYPVGASIVEPVGGNDYSIAGATTNVALAESPITFAVAVNNSGSYVSHAGDSLTYTISFANNSSVAFQNIVITAKLAGTMFDLSSLSTNGSFNSVSNVITWNGAASPQLLSLAPGQSGSVTLFVRTKNAFPIRLLSDKNYSVSVNAHLQSPTVPPNTQASSTISVASLATKLGGQVVLSAKAYHKEPTANITNSGPYPPRVNKATQYTVHWLLTNYATDADNVTISAYLQSGATCTGVERTPASTTVACNPSSGQVTWQIPVVAATTGISGKPLEAVFQITNTPAVNQVGQTINLLGSAALTATDGFTGAVMQSSVGPVTTAMPDDQSVSTNQRGVQP